MYALEGVFCDAQLSRLLKKSASFVLASLRGSTYSGEYASPLYSLRPCWTAFLNSLRAVREPSATACTPCFPIPELLFNTLLATQQVLLFANPAVQDLLESRVDDEATST